MQRWELADCDERSKEDEGKAGTKKKGGEMLKGRENPTPARAEKRRCQLHPESVVENAALLWGLHSEICGTKHRGDPPGPRLS